MNAIPNAGSAQRLADLAARARAELDMLSFATKTWVSPRFEDGRKLLDVLVIGAGQSGLALGLALKRRGITNIELIDRNPRGYEGVWDTYARNHEIRSPKDITGTDLGFPSLSIRTFYEAKHGAGAWDLIARVPRLDWMDYLRWYREIADLPIRNEVEVVDIDYDADGVTVTTATGEAIRSRLLVLATGMDGGGAWHIPEIVSANLPRERYHHTGEIVPREVLAGRRLGVLGAGAAAFDIAVTALTSGATSVDMFMRRSSPPMIDAAREMEHGGGLDHGHTLSDATKWEISKFMGGLSQSPAEHHFFKAFGFENFALHLGSPWNAVHIDGEEIVLSTPKGEHRVDHIFTAAGVEIDMAKRPELAKIAAKAAFWRDRFTPPEADPSPRRLNFPYLGDCYQFTEREAGSAPGIGRIYAFNALATMSMGGMSAVSISSHKFGVPRLASGIAGVLFREQEHEILPMLQGFTRPGIVIPPEIRTRIGLPREEAAAASPR